jgi:pimeloyl-ACP methyl ester carboxylesterase
MNAVSLVGTALNRSSLVAPGLAGKGCFRLFRNAKPRGKIRDGEREVHDRAVVEELSVNGKRVVTYRWGDGARPVLLVHGWQSRASRFAGFVPRLEAAGFSPIGFDAPGHGDSGGRTTTILEYRETIRLLQARYGPFDAAIAHSFGVLAAFLALRGTLNAARLVTIAGVSEMQFLFDEFCRRLALNDLLIPDRRRRIEQDMFPDTAENWQRFDATHRREEITPPMLVIHDHNDDTAPITQAHRLKAAYGDQAQLITTAGLGHRKILNHPAVIDAALDFLTVPAKSLRPSHHLPNPTRSTERQHRHEAQDRSERSIQHALVTGAAFAAAALIALATTNTRERPERVPRRRPRTRSVAHRDWSRTSHSGDLTT